MESKKIKQENRLTDRENQWLVGRREGALKSLFFNNFKWSKIYKNCKLLGCIPETSIILEINYTSIKPFF